MNLYLVRHGQVKHNVDKKFVSLKDENLTDKGVEQIERLGRYFKGINFDEIYTSERKRTIMTARAIKPNSIINIDKRLNEANFGIFENLTYEEIARLYPEESRQWEANWQDYKIPKGESMAELYDRVKNFIEELKEKKRENVLVVSHGGIIKLFYCYVLGGNVGLYWNFSCHNGQVSLIKYEYGNWYIDGITKNEDIALNAADEEGVK